MAHKHEPDSPLPLEALITGLGELESVLGQQVAPVLAGIRATLIAALAARDRGDPPAAVGHIGRAMEQLTTLADQLDPGEAGLMRALGQSFRAALLRGDEAQVKQTTTVMLQKSGAVERKRS